MEIVAGETESTTLSAEVAQNPSTPPKVLAELARDTNKYMRKMVARNPSTPPEVLSELARDPNKGVREAVAENPSIPPGVLAELAHDTNMYMRMAVVGNPSIPPKVLAELVRDPSENVRKAVAKNPSFPAEVLAELARDPDKGVQKAVAGNPSAPTEVLAELARDPDKDVQKAVAGNPSIQSLAEPIIHLTKLAPTNRLVLIGQIDTLVGALTDNIKATVSGSNVSPPFDLRLQEYSEFLSEIRRLTDVLEGIRDALEKGEQPSEIKTTRLAGDALHEFVMKMAGALGDGFGKTITFGARLALAWFAIHILKDMGLPIEHLLSAEPVKALLTRPH